LSVPGGQRVRSDMIMKKARNKRVDDSVVDIDDILPEYDFRHAKRNKYAARYSGGSVIVVLEPDVAESFPTSREANEALRALAGIIKKHRTGRANARRSS
jgi:hypothetical protein